MKVKVGCAYYPEAWDATEIEQDAKLMEEAGISLVRMGEFAWSHMEPSDGMFDFAWLTEALAVLAMHHIRVVLCTPTSTAPAWLCRKHPEILRVNFEGQRAYFGIRDHSCYTSSVYKSYAARLIENLLLATRGATNIEAWQIDNEIGHSIFGQCCCRECKEDFRRFLKSKYGTIDKLNRCWGNSFWSREYSSFDEIDIGEMDRKLDSSIMLDTLICRSNAVIRFIEEQASLIRRFTPGVKITTNNLSGLVDRYKAYRNLDVAAIDYYPHCEGGLECMARNVYYSSLYAGIKPGTAPWILETSPSPGEPEVNLQRFFLWEFTAHGNETILYFHFHTHLGGYEKTHGTFINYTGKTRDCYLSLKSSVGELDRILSDYPKLPMPDTPVGIIFDYENHWTFSQGSCRMFAEYEKASQHLHRAFLENGIQSAVISPDSDFSHYRILAIPIQPHITKAFAAKLEKFVAAGGFVLLGGPSGIFDGNAKYIPQSGPEHLEKVFGMTIEDYISFNSAEILVPFEPREIPTAGNVIFSGKLGDHFVSGRAGKWIAVLELHGAKKLMTYSNTILKGKTFLSENDYGKGKAYYFGTQTTDHESMRAIVAFLLDTAKIMRPVLPPGVELVRRGKVVFLFNHTAEAHSFPYDEKAHAVLGDFLHNGIVSLPAYEVCILV